MVNIAPVTKIALILMIVLLLGLGENAKYGVVVILVFSLVALNTLAGVQNIDERYSAGLGGHSCWHQFDQRLL